MFHNLPGDLATPTLTRIRCLIYAQTRIAERDYRDVTQGLGKLRRLTLIDDLRSRVASKLGGQINVACCFEAGRDGFWLYRVLTAHGIVAYVLEPTSILVNRRARRAKTDRLDAEGMLRVLAAWLNGDRQVCSMVRVPSPEEEDAKRPHRECEHLVQERLRIENRIEALLFTQGIRGRPSPRAYRRWRRLSRPA
jgi:transposase